jgi:hypothetical protein
MTLFDWFRLLVHAQKNCPGHNLGGIPGVRIPDSIPDITQVDWANAQGTPEEWAAAEAAWEEAQGNHQEGCAKMLDFLIQGLVQLAGRLHATAKTAYVTFHQVDGGDGVKQWQVDVRNSVPIKSATEKERQQDWIQSGTGTSPEIACAQVMQKLLSQVRQRNTDDQSALETARKGYEALGDAAKKAAQPATV